MVSVRDAQRVEADMHLAATSAAASRVMQDLVTNASADPVSLEQNVKQVAALTNLLRLTHVWNRFASGRKDALPVEEEKPYDPYQDVDPVALAELEAAQAESDPMWKHR